MYGKVDPTSREVLQADVWHGHYILFRHCVCLDKACLQDTSVQPRCNPDAIMGKPAPIRRVDTVCLDVDGNRWLAEVTP